MERLRSPRHRWSISENVSASSAREGGTEAFSIATDNADMGSGRWKMTHMSVLKKDFNDRRLRDRCHAINIKIPEGRELMFPALLWKVATLALPRD